MKRLLISIVLLVSHVVTWATADNMRRPISPSQPAWLIHIDVWNYADPQKIIDMVPEDVRPYVIFNIATSSSDDKSADGPAIYDSWMKVCAQNRVWTMIQCASGYANRMPDTPGDVSAYEQYFKDYPNFLGFNFAEQYWGFDGSGDGAVSFDNRLQLFARLLSLAKTYGGYLAVSFADSYHNANKMPVAYMKRNADINTFLSSSPEYFLCFEKYTQKKNFLYNESHCLGAWLSGFAGQYGIRFDSSGWVENGVKPDAQDGDTQYTIGTSDFVRAAGAIPVAEHVMLTGQTIMDGPELTWKECSTEGSTTTDADGFTHRNWEWFPQFNHITLDLFRKILDGTIRIPSKDEVMARTKVCVVNGGSGTDNDSYRIPAALYDGLYRNAADYGGLQGRDVNHWLNNRWWMKSTGRYPAIPNMLAAGSLTDISSYIDSKESKVNLLNGLFPEEHTGNIYAGRHENGWVTYNPYQYDDVTTDGIRTLSTSTTRATGNIPFRYNSCTSVDLDYAPYSLGIMKEYANKVTFYMQNYEGGTDVIKINGATAKPAYTKTDHGSETSTVSESWADGVYTLTITHQGGAVDLTIDCAGSATDRQTASEAVALTMAPALPDEYTGILQYEAELADYKNTTIRKSGYNQGRDNYQGQGFAELSGSGSALRFNVVAPKSGYYLLTLRYQTDAAGSAKVDDETLMLAQSDGWTNVQTIIRFDEGKGAVILQNGSSQKLYIDGITLESIKAEAFTLDEKGEFHVGLSDLIASGTISIDASTGIVTQSTGGQNASGSLRLFLDHADFTKVTSLKVEYEGNGDIFKSLTISDNYGNTANPTGSQGAFWSSKYSLDYTGYQKTEASKQICKLEWTANAPESTPRTMTIKDIVIKGRASCTAIEQLDDFTNGQSHDWTILQSDNNTRIYNIGGQQVKAPGKGIRIVKISDRTIKLIIF